ncbi:MAG: 2-amino-4-hydroxy-6-hydroxymethyldihydropteridine diphosphokinase, partial [Chloroflexi bacterium]|nr:2-amino-4-hydroxy-6-hydroxymethyldihydropteridine diphosphokinase [Chloroflexota bacterium]
MSIVYLGLGSNLGDREAHLREVLSRLQEAGVRGAALSPLYETDPVGYLNQPDFLNAVCRAETDLFPHELLRALKAI